MTLARCSARAAKCSSASASAGQRPVSPSTSRRRISSAPGAPPGSRVVTTVSPDWRKASASRRSWVDLPPPSPPSNVTNLSGGRTGVDISRSPGSVGLSLRLRRLFGLLLLGSEDHLLQHGDHPAAEAELRHFLRRDQGR